MRKRLFVVAATAFLVGQALIVTVQYARGRSFLPPTAIGRRADDFQQILRLIEKHYVRSDEVSVDRLATTALKSMLRSLDPHSEYLSSGEYRSFQVETSQEFGGIGVQIEIRDNRLTVVAPIAGTPAAQAGLLRGDQFIAVDGANVADRSLDECTRLLRGEVGTEVALTLFRPRTGETLERVVKREKIKVESVRDTRLLGDGVGYVRVVQFGERTGSEFLEALQSLERQGARGLVLDLRDNPGGLLDSAVAVAEPFFNRDELVVYTQGADPRSREESRADPGSAARTYPVAVLINSGSASASEIVAGALRDTGRAVLVGEKSFGKGSVQTVIPLNGGTQAVRLTTALYYLPSGEAINGNGIEPDIPITLTADEDRKLAAQRNRLGLMTPEEFERQFEFKPIEDRQLTAAVDAVRGVLAFTAIEGAAAAVAP